MNSHTPATPPLGAPQDATSHTPANLAAYATTPPLCPYLSASYRTLNRHRVRDAFDRNAALRLLRNNARDAARNYCRLHRIPGPWRATFDDAALDRLALALYAHWRLTCR